MISDRHLQRWDDFLGAKSYELDALHIAVTGEAHVASPEMVVFLEMNDRIVKDKVEQAAKEFALSESWPQWLTGDQIINLTHRVRVGRALLQSILGRQLPNAQLLRMPRSNDRAKFIRWLLIEAWDMVGAAYLRALTNRYLADAGGFDERSH